MGASVPKLSPKGPKLDGLPEYTSQHPGLAAQVQDHLVHHLSGTNKKCARIKRSCFQVA